jgi:mannose-1-phosphate guanylyltransferase
MNKNYYAILMAGGVGSRFWPVSTTEFPKQFHDMLGAGETLIQKTFSRLSQLIPAVLGRSQRRRSQPFRRPIWWR